MKGKRKVIEVTEEKERRKGEKEGRNRGMGKRQRGREGRERREGMKGTKD